MTTYPKHIQYFMIMLELPERLLFRPHLWGGGGGLYTQMGFFCSVNFGRSIYSSQRNVSGIIKKLVQRSIQNQKDYQELKIIED